MLEQALYSPDFAPFNFYLFPNMKKFLAGKQFGSNMEVIAAVDGHSVDLT